MKYVAAGLGLVWVAACFVACSGSTLSSKSTPAQNDGGFDAEAGAEAGPGTCKLDTDCAHGFCDPARNECVECLTASDCGAGKQCAAGLCKTPPCVPNSTFCSNGSVVTCSADGASSVAAQHCTADQFCLEKNNTATCSATACFPGDAMCAGNLATSCEPDGSGPKPGGTDCSASKQACYSGGCRDLVCTPGATLCNNGGLYLCSDAGTSRALLSTCGSGQTCDADAGACRPKICDPGKLGCDSTRVVTCNDAGSAWKQTGPDCATTNGTCVNGACAAIACTPGQSFCMGTKVYQCSPDGTSSTTSQDCAQYQNTQQQWQCTTRYGFAQCTPDACVPNAVGCNGTVLSTCKADGSDWQAGGTDCSLTSQVCSGTQCVTPVCTPNTTFCAQGNVQQCDDTGMLFSQAQFCPVGAACKVDGMVANCDPTPCFPDTTACVGEKLGHCAADGLSVGGTVTNCTTTSQVCTLQGCASSALNVVSGTAQVSTGYDSEMQTNIVSVESSRKLTSIEVYLSLPAARTLTWVVFEQTNANSQGELDLKYQKVTTGVTGVGYASSGPISLELQAGKSYAIGVSVGGGSYIYYYDVVASPALDFAHAIGDSDQSFSTTIDNFFPSQGQMMLFAQRLGTTVP